VNQLEKALEAENRLLQHENNALKEQLQHLKLANAFMNTYISGEMTPVDPLAALEHVSDAASYTRTGLKLGDAKNPAIRDSHDYGNNDERYTLASLTKRAEELEWGRYPREPLSEEDEKHWGFVQRLDELGARMDAAYGVFNDHYNDLEARVAALEGREMERVYDNISRERSRIFPEGVGPDGEPTFRRE
jgi:hypothetical protein